MEARPQISRAEEQFDTLFTELIQKGRVTEADYDRATDSLATGATTEASLVAQWSPYALDVGCRVLRRRGVQVAATSSCAPAGRVRLSWQREIDPLCASKVWGGAQSFPAHSDLT